MQKGHSDVTTDGIRIRVGAQYLPSQSSPDGHRFTYAYRVRIDNVGESSAKLMRREWIVLDSENERRVVRGPGVVGEQPRIEPGGKFEYVSGSTLPTEWGTMEGGFHFVRDDGEEFVARIGRFFLTPSLAPLGALD